MGEDSVTGPNEIRIWGPPGCGKTTYLSRQVLHAVAKYGVKAVLVTSFTRAAAEELAMRNLPLHKECMGTLHSVCYRALEYPEIADAHVPEWNRENPQFRLTPAASDVDEMEIEFVPHTHGDELYGTLQTLRAKMEPPERWPLPVRRFAVAWEEWKRDHGMMDFTDLLEVALRDFKIAPGDPQVVFVDEAQDLSLLQLALVRQWGRHANHLLLAGDDDQGISNLCWLRPQSAVGERRARVLPACVVPVLSCSTYNPRA
jgi:superfamily I DNA/RNA helicase